MRRPLARAARLLPVLGLAAVAVTGCSGAVHAGAAATIGDHRIGEQQLRELSDHTLSDAAIAQQVGDANRDALQRALLSRLIDNQLVDIALGQRHVAVTDADVDSVVQQLTSQPGATPQALAQFLEGRGYPSGDLRAWARDQARVVVLLRSFGADITSTTVQGQAQALVRQIAAHDGVSVNPRFGAWDPAAGDFGGVVPPSGGSPLSTPSPGAPAPGGPTPAP